VLDCIYNHSIIRLQHNGCILPKNCVSAMKNFRHATDSKNTADIQTRE